MSDRKDAVLVSTDKNGKKRYTKVGSFWISDKGISLSLDQGVSVSTPPGVFLNAYEPKPRDNGGGGDDF